MLKLFGMPQRDISELDLLNSKKERQKTIPHINFKMIKHKYCITKLLFYYTFLFFTCNSSGKHFTQIKHNFIT